MPARPIHTLDVFTHAALAGNPLAVVHDASGLDTAAMQRIAGEFNLSETVFILPETTAGHRADIRIFTPGAELPFAGHPTVGTAVLLASLDGLAPGARRRSRWARRQGPSPAASAATRMGATPPPSSLPASRRTWGRRPIPPSSPASSASSRATSASTGTGRAATARRCPSATCR